MYMYQPLSTEDLLEVGKQTKGSAAGLGVPNMRQREVQDMGDMNNNLEKICVKLQLGKTSCNEQELNTILANHYRNSFYASDVQILETISWKYFQR